MRRLAIVLIAMPMLALSFGPLVRNMMLDIASRRADDLGPVTDGLFAYWSMDDRSSDGNTVFDSVGDEDNTWTGTAAYTSGVRFDAASIVGSSYMAWRRAETILTNDLEHVLSMSIWIRANTTNATGYIAYAATGVQLARINQYYSLLQVGETIEVNVNNKQTTVPETIGEWMHLVFVSPSQNKLQVYVNGEQVRDITGTGILRDKDSAGFGARASNDDFSSGAFYFDGDVDEARIYDRALSAAEITELYEWDKEGAGH